MSATLDGGGFARGVPSPSPRRRRIPWPPVIAFSVMGLIGLAGLLPTGPEPVVRVLSERNLRAVDEADGSLAMVDVSTGAVTGRIPAEGDSFVRGVLSGINYRRRLHSVPLDVPFHLVAYDNGRLVLSDARTGTSIDLEAFGPDNLASFAKMLTRPENAP